MADRYVSPYGTDDGSHGTSISTPYLTIQYAVNNCSAGDTLYICPGVYRANTTLTASGSSGSPINVIGDASNSQGFVDGSGAHVPAGEIRMTSFLTDDVSAATSGCVLLLTGVAYVNFSNIWFVCVTPSGGPTGSVQLQVSSHDVNFTSCIFSHGAVVASTYSLMNLVNSTTQTALNVTIDRCTFLAIGGNGIAMQLQKSDVSEYSSNVLVQNSLFAGGSDIITIASNGSATNKGGGVNICGCTFLDGRGTTITVKDANISTTYPVSVYNNVILRTNSPSLSANASGQIVEDYNYLVGSKTNVTAGTHSIADSSNCVLLDVGQWNMWGQYPRPFLSPTQNSPQLGFAPLASGMSNHDWMNRSRPEGGKSSNTAIGYMERHDTGKKETSVVDSGSSIRLTGPSSQILYLPVDTTSTTISIKSRHDYTYGSGSPPQLMLMSNPEIGLADNYGGSGISQVVTAPTTVDTWSTISLSAFTPTQDGVAKILLVNRGTSGSGNAYFDTVTVA